MKIPCPVRILRQRVLEMEDTRINWTLEQLCLELDASYHGTDDLLQRAIRSVNALEAAEPDQMTFVTGPQYVQSARRSGAGAFLVHEIIDGLEAPQLLVRDVGAALIDVLTLMAPKMKAPAQGVHPSASIPEDVEIGPDVSIGPHVTVESGVRIGDRSVIGAGSFIGQASCIGSDSRLDANVVVYHHCQIGSHVIIQANSVIGATGFGYAAVDGKPVLYPHNGSVVIEDYVEIGANCCIDKAKFTNTIIGFGTKMDNFVQVGHNVSIGRCCLIAAHVGIAGSCRIGDGVILAGQVGCADNITIGDGVQVGAQAGVMNSVQPGKKLIWTPAIEQDKGRRVVAEVIRLPKTISRLKQLIKRVERLESAADDTSKR